MVAGLMDLVFTNNEDNHIIGNPQISFFKSVYRRHTNFSIQSIRQNPVDGVDFGTKTSYKLSKNGDLISRMWFEIQLPKAETCLETISGVYDDSLTYVRWVDSIGHALFKEISIYFGASLIDKHTPEWLEIWNELTDPHRHLWKSIGKLEKIPSEDNQYNQKLYVPLMFWFNRNVGQSIPIVSLDYSELYLKIETRDLDSLINTDCQDGVDYNGFKTDINLDMLLYIDYIFLDDEERRRFAQNNHEFLIETIQHKKYNILEGNNTVKLDFNHPVKELIWFIRHNTRTQNTNIKLNTLLTDTNGNDLLNFSSIKENTELGLGTYDSFSSAQLLFNNSERFESRDAVYFRQVQPLQHHSNIPKKHIYSYSFALKPEEYQPSGTCNFSRIDDAKLIIKGVPNSDSSEIQIFAFTYNILRISDGMSGFAYDHSTNDEYISDKIHNIDNIDNSEINLENINNINNIQKKQKINSISDLDDTDLFKDVFDDDNEYNLQPDSIENFTQEPNPSKPRVNNSRKDIVKNIVNNGLPLPKSNKNKAKTKDIVINVNIKLKDIHNNVKKTLNIKRSRLCLNCKGKGFTDKGICKVCNGTAYAIYNKTIKFFSKQKHVVLKNESNEEKGKITGDIIINVIPKK